MRIQNLGLAVAFCSLSGFAVSAQAQRLSDRLREATDVSVCRSGGTASRVKRDCNPERTQTSRLEIERTTTIELSVDNSDSCSALIDLEYYQRNMLAHVEGTIANDACAASEGRYVVTARIRNADGEIEALDFEETWRRSDDQPIEIEADYLIGENVDLIRLRTRGVTCRCEEDHE
jgi:hypothetical protein